MRYKNNKTLKRCEIHYYYYIPDLYSAIFMPIMFKAALHSFAATRAQVHRLPVQIQSDLIRGIDEAKPLEERHIN